MEETDDDGKFTSRERMSERKLKFYQNKFTFSEAVSNFLGKFSFSWGVTDDTRVGKCVALLTKSK